MIRNNRPLPPQAERPPSVHPDAIENIERQDSSQTLPEMKKVPNKTLNAFGAKIKFDKNLRADVIYNNEYVEFVEELHKTLSTMDKNSIKYKENVLLFIMQSCENYILHKNAGQRRKLLVIDVAKQYLYDGNTDLIAERIIELLPQIKNHKFFGRNCRKIMRFFFGFL